MKRLVTALLVAGLLTACSESEPTDVASVDPSAQETTADTPPPPSECDNIEDVTSELFAASLVATEAKGKGFSKMLNKVEQATSEMQGIYYTVESHLEDYGPFEGGDDCLNMMGSALEVAIEALFGGGYFEEFARDNYQLLLMYYPDSPHGLDAENYLAEKGYPVPEPEV